VFSINCDVFCDLYTSEQLFILGGCFVVLGKKFKRCDVSMRKKLNYFSCHDILKITYAIRQSTNKEIYLGLRHP
jgi:hypothetical protein